MEECTLTRQQADDIMAADPEGPYSIMSTNLAEYLILNDGVIEDGTHVNITIVGRIIG